MIGKRTLFIYLLAVWISSCEVPINPLPTSFLVCLLFLTDYGNSLCSLNTILCQLVHDANSFSHSVGWLFTFYWGLSWTRVLNFNIILWFILSFNGLFFCVSYWRKSFTTLRLWWYSLAFFWKICWCPLHI